MFSPQVFLFYGVASKACAKTGTMQFLWIVPSLGYGIFLLVTTGQWFGLVFGGFSLISLLLAQFFRNRTLPVAPDQPVHFGHRRIAIGNRVLPRLEILWKPEWVEQVYLSLAAKNQNAQARLRLAAKLQGSLAADKTSPGQPCIWLGFDGPDSIDVNLADCGGHAILVGPTGSGKSQLLASMLVSVCHGYSPNELRLALVDYKGGSALRGFATTPWCFGFETDLDDSAGALADRVRRELTERALLLADRKVARLQDLPKNARPPALVLAVDELLALLQNSSAQKALEDIAARGRSLGIHLVVTSQSLNGIPRSLLVNLGLRIAVGKPDPIDLAQLGMVRQAEQLGVQQNLYENWISAQYSTPSKTGNFLFPAGGAVSANLGKYLFLDESKTKDYSKAFFATDFVEKPMKNFDFSIGFQ
jgi:S-DNA-T family DNA segregation ATPase FtsK/SpoIIIE